MICSEGRKEAHGRTSLSLRAFSGLRRSWRGLIANSGTSQRTECWLAIGWGQSTFEGGAILVALAGSCFPVTPAINACQQFIPILKNEETHGTAHSYRSGTNRHWTVSSKYR